MIISERLLKTAIPLCHSSEPQEQKKAASLAQGGSLCECTYELESNHILLFVSFQFIP